MLRSEHILKGLGNQYYRATYKSMGFTTEDLKRPLIGIANAWSECVPGHYNLRQVAQRVKDGIYRAGGTPIEFGVIGGCDGMGQGHDGMHFIMPSRELIANSIESMAQINLFDGLVLLGSCDKIVPGMLMAAARLNIPSILVSSGPMLAGHFGGEEVSLSKTFEAVGAYKAGMMDEDYINDYTYREEGTVFPLTVPEGEVFLMGDNRNHSNDSRDSSLGTVDTRLLIGKAVFLVFPGRDYLTEQREFGRIGLLK